MPEIVKLLIANKANVNAISPAGETALSIAVKKLSEDGPSRRLQMCIDLLRAAGAKE